MARVFRVQQVNSDGSSAESTTFSYFPDCDAQGKPFCNEDGEPWIAVTLRPVSSERHREFVKAHTTTAANGSGVMQQEIDWAAVNADTVAYGIVDWVGFEGADGKPLKCIDATKRALDAVIQLEIRNRVMYAQPAEVAAASFREPARLRAVVGGLREDDAVLSTRDA